MAPSSENGRACYFAGVEFGILNTTAGDYKEGEGEIMAHGPNVMLRINYKQPEINAQVFKTI